MKKAFKIIANVLLWLIVIFALLITILVFSSSNSGGVSHLMGFIPLTVESQSMSPTFNEGDLIICQQIDDVNTLVPGDVITFWTLIDGQKVKNTHRIVKVNKTETSVSFITRGDNNPIDDEMPAYQAEIIGKWTNIKLSGAGNIMAFLRTKLGFFVCILIPMALFFLFELYKFIITVIQVRKGELEPQLDEEEIKRRAIEEYLAAQKAKEGGSPETSGKSEEKPESAKEDTAEKAKDTAVEKPEKPKEETAEKPEDKTEKAKEETAEKPEDKADKPKEETAEKPEDKTEKAKKDTAEKPEDKADKAKEETAEKPEDKADKPKEEAAEKPEDKADKAKEDEAGKNDEKAEKADENKSSDKEKPAE